MKRINPKTNQPFIFGDVREDGYLFSGYHFKRVRADGFFIENWISPENYKTYRDREKLENISLEGLAGKLLKNAKSRAKKKNGNVTITKAWILDRLKKGKSELSGLPFDTTRKSKSLYAPSLDRIDSNNRNYDELNCRLILWGENQALNDSSDEELLPILKGMARAISKNVKRKQSAPVPTPGARASKKRP